MSDKLPDDKDGLLDLLKKIGAPIAGFIGAVTLVYNFYRMWLGDQENVTAITAGIGLIVLIVALWWVGSSKKTIYLSVSFPIGAKVSETSPRYSQRARQVAWLFLGVIFLSVIGGVYLLGKHRQELKDKLVILIAAFEGPEEVYGLRNEIIENLNADFSGDEKIEIVIVDDVITLTQGTEHARKLGANRLADIVIWGWYRPTENPNITIHIENITPSQLSPLEANTNLHPEVALGDLESFVFQQQAGEEISALISLLIGIVHFDVGEYTIASSRFGDALEKENIISKY